MVLTHIIFMSDLEKEQVNAHDSVSYTHLDVYKRPLMKDKRVTELVCATDAGREGELNFRLVYNKTGCTKPFKRLRISSLEGSDMREGFHHLRDSKEYDRLYEAALSRSKADWIVGINGTRLFRCV